MSIKTPEIEKILDYKFDDPKLLRQAFTRRTYSAENGGPDNKILAFIGDRVLDLAVTMILIDHYGIDSASNSPEVKGFRSKTLEEFFTKLKADLVQEKSLSSRITSLGFHKYLIMGIGDIKQNLQEEDSVKEELFEAIIGAVALDCNFNMQTIVSVAKKMIDFNSYFKNV